MEKVRPWFGQPSDRGRLKKRTGQIYIPPARRYVCKVEHGTSNGLERVENSKQEAVDIERRSHYAVQTVTTKSFLYNLCLATEHTRIINTLDSSFFTSATLT